jgi:hypothetical protein
LLLHWRKNRGLRLQISEIKKWKIKLRFYF